jgi:hypothetical protein
MSEENANQENNTEGQGEAPPATPPAAPSVEIDSRLYTEDGKFNKEGAEAYIKEQKEKEDKAEKRIKDLRVKLSAGKEAPEKPDEYFLDYKAPEKYAKLFDEKAPSKAEVDKLKDKFSKAFHSSVLTKKQAEDMSNLMLETLEEYGVVDARTEEQRKIADIERRENTRKELGPNADSIIRESELFVKRTDMFDENTQKQLLGLMDRLGAGFISTIHQLRGMVGDSAGRNIPVNPQALDGLKPDSELAREYLDPATTQARKDEIIRLRHAANRPGRLMQSIGK